MTERYPGGVVVFEKEAFFTVNMRCWTYLVHSSPWSLDLSLVRIRLGRTAAGPKTIRDAADRVSSPEAGGSPVQGVIRLRPVGGRREERASGGPPMEHFTKTGRCEMAIEICKISFFVPQFAESKGRKLPPSEPKAYCVLSPVKKTKRFENEERLLGGIGCPRLFVSHPVIRCLRESSRPSCHAVPRFVIGW